MHQNLFPKKDIVEKFVRSSGPGGQNVNKVATTVFLKHLATGIIIKCGEFRTQEQNREEAYRRLFLKIKEREEEQERKRMALILKIRRQNRRRSKGQKERMLEDKKFRSFKKNLRKGVED